MHELKATLENIGDVKIIVGERNNKRIIHYCITKKKKEQPKCPRLPLDLIDYP